MSDFGVTWVSFLSLFFGALVTLVLPLWMIVKSKQKNKTDDFSPERDVVDQQALDEAQKHVDSMDLRAEIAKNHDRIRTFNSMHGFDHSVMYDLVGKFLKKGISAEFIFVQAMPDGAASYSGGVGTFEFFVQRDKREEGEKLLNEILSS